MKYKKIVKKWPSQVAEAQSKAKRDSVSNHILTYMKLICKFFS